jgi:hypothetical protein
MRKTPSDVGISVTRVEWRAAVLGGDASDLNADSRAPRGAPMDIEIATRAASDSTGTALTHLTDAA